jgi:hypothetical protein
MSKDGGSGFEHRDKEAEEVYKFRSFGYKRS